ncbi:MAG: hypothetical protein ACI9RV_001061 [Glaciecola sp.]
MHSANVYSLRVKNIDKYLAFKLLWDILSSIFRLSVDSSQQCNNSWGFDTGYAPSCRTLALNYVFVSYFIVY